MPIHDDDYIEIDGADVGQRKHVFTLVDCTDAAIREALAAAGYHVVAEGQAVVDGEVWVLWHDPAMPNGPYWLRPLPQPPPVVDEMTTTTTAKEGE